MPEYKYNYPMPAITSDIIICRDSDTAKGGIEICLIERGEDPWKGKFAMPGGHFDVNSDKSIAHCAARELEEETNIVVQPEDLLFIGFADAKDRDPRGRYVTFVYVIILTQEQENTLLVKSDAKSFKWFDIDNLPEMAADHADLIKEFVSAMDNELDDWGL